MSAVLFVFTLFSLFINNVNCLLQKKKRNKGKKEKEEEEIKECYEEAWHQGNVFFTNADENLSHVTPQIYCMSFDFNEIASSDIKC